MSNAQSTLDTFYHGWLTYQWLLCAALAPLSDEQLALRPAPALRSIGESTLHIIGGRARWFSRMLGEGGPAFEDMATWDRPGAPARGAAELVAALHRTWQVMHEAIARWTPAEWAVRYDNDPGDEPASFTREWVIWHLIEHDIHHGGEISLTLGMHGIPALDL